MASFPPPGARRQPGTVALARALSKLGAASRAEARRLIAAGRVTVNGRVVEDAMAAVVPEHDDIRCDGRRAARAAWRTIAFHKPRGTITSRRDPEGRRTIFDVLGPTADGLVAVGRLDYASSGLLLLTNDTQLAEWLTNPVNEVPREYVVTARGAVADEDAARMLAGLDGLRASALRIRKRSRRETHALVELTEGRNREVRRLFAATGHEVTRLLRIRFGPVTLGDLAPGEWREVPAAVFRRPAPVRSR
jgi:23S rRNA pseudouridine2605 synthase